MMNIIESKLSEQAAYSVQQVSELTTLSKSFVRNEIRDGNLKGRRIGRRVLVLASDLENYLENGKDAKKIN